MKHLNKSIFLLTGIALLSSCNANLKADLKVIKDEDAIKIAQSILDRQNSKYFIVYENPTNFVSKLTTKSSNNSLLVSGKKNIKSEKTVEFYYDLKNLKVKKITTEKGNDDYSSYESYKESIYFFETELGVFYELENINGYKKRYVTHDLSQEDVKEKIIESANTYFAAIKAQTKLNNFETQVNEFKKLHEEYASKSDEYFNYTLGSNNAKSIQIKKDSKFKYKELQPINRDMEFNGFVFNKNNVILRDDKLSYYNDLEKTQMENSDGRFYINKSTETTHEFTYGNASFKLPNITDYIVG